MIRHPAWLVSALLLFTSCAGNVAPDLAETCATELAEARKELEAARAKGLAGRIQWIKAANLLSAADARLQVEKYDVCAEKVRRARLFIRSVEQPAEQSSE